MTRIGDEIFRILKAILHASGFENSINAGFVLIERKTAVFLRTQRRKATTDFWFELESQLQPEFNHARRAKIEHPRSGQDASGTSGGGGVIGRTCGCGISQSVQHSAERVTRQVKVGVIECVKG